MPRWVYASMTALSFLYLTFFQLGASHKNFIAVQNANTSRDIATKVREDPLLAIKQQEQAAYHALLSNPLRLRELQERCGINPKKDKKAKKKEKREKKERKKERARERGRSWSRSRSRSRAASPSSSYGRRRSPSYERDRSRSRFSPARGRSPVRFHRDERRYGRDQYRPNRSRSCTPDSYRHRPDEYVTRRDRGWPRSDSSESLERAINGDSRKRRRDFSPKNGVNGQGKRTRVTPPPSGPRQGSYHRPEPGPGKLANDANDRAARLAAMQSDAASMGVERQKRLLELLEKEKSQLEAENRAREESKGMGDFLSQEQKKVFGGAGDLEDRIKRGRHGLVAEAD